MGHFTFAQYARLLQRIRMPGLHSRNKGKRGEREVVDLFRANGYSAHRTAPMQAGRNEEGYPDVLAVGNLKPNIDSGEEKIRFRVESKFRDRIPPLDDVLELGKKFGTNVVFSRRTRKQMLVTMEAEFFFNLMRPLIEPQEYKPDATEGNGSEAESG